MNQFLTITWSMSKGIDLGIITLRFYSLLFAGGFVLGYFLMKRIFAKEGVSMQKLDALVTYTVVATIVGARLGHVFFYQWDYYAKHPIEIFKVWEGGLASHGAAVAIIIAIVIYSRKVLKKSPLWMLDRLVITIALAGALIRLGNWFNSEIYGNMGNSSLQTVFVEPPRDYLLRNFEFIEEIDFSETGETFITDSLDLPMYTMHVDFINAGDKANLERTMQTRIIPVVNNFNKENKNIYIPADASLRWKDAGENILELQVLGIPRAPTQLYEALGYFLIFLVLYRIYMVRRLALSQGFIFGAFLVLVFGFRFVIEYGKENQVAAEEGFSLNIGQMLSIPLVLFGLYFLFTAHKKRLHE
jgi:prolipoprotein diacylglyceryltransferase